MEAERNQYMKKYFYDDGTRLVAEQADPDSSRMNSIGQEGDPARNPVFEKGDAGGASVTSSKGDEPKNVMSYSAFRNRYQREGVRTIKPEKGKVRRLCQLFEAQIQLEMDRVRMKK